MGHKEITEITLHEKNILSALKEAAYDQYGPRCIEMGIDYDERETIVRVKLPTSFFIEKLKVVADADAPHEKTA